MEWKEFKAEDGSFSVMLPGEVEVDKADPKMLKVAGKLDEKHAFMVSKNEMAPPLTKFTDEAVKGIIDSMEKDGSKVTKHQTMEAQGHPALNLVIVAKDKTEMEMVQILAGKHLYQLLSIKMPGAEPFGKADEEKFGASFKILK